MNKMTSQALRAAFTLLISLVCFSQQALADSEMTSADSEIAGTALEIRVTGAKANTGQVIGSLFSSKETFLKEAELTQTLAVDEQGNASFIFTNLASGSYAASVIFDENKDGKMNSFLGIPSEAFGFSNDVKGLFGPPSFEKASFQFPHKKVITIQLGKVKD